MTLPPVNQSAVQEISPFVIASLSPVWNVVIIWARAGTSSVGKGYLISQMSSARASRAHTLLPCVFASSTATAAHWASQFAVESDIPHLASNDEAGNRGKRVCTTIHTRQTHSLEAASNLFVEFFASILTANGALAAHNVQGSSVSLHVSSLTLASLHFTS